jgi:hypothetical protein
MPEAAAFVDLLRAGRVVTVGPVTVLPVERLVLYMDRGSAGVWFTAAKEPYALVLRDAGGIRAVNTCSAPIPLDVLRAQVPDLDAALAQR